MAGRVLSRRKLRDEHDLGTRIEEETARGDESPGPEAGVKKPRVRKATAAKAKPVKVKAPPKPRARKKAVKVPPRMFARWAVCDGGMKRVAVFGYKDRVGADARLAEMVERKPGAYFLLLVKDPYDPPAEEPATDGTVATV